MIYSVFNNLGEIIKIISCPKNMLYLQVQPNEFAIKGGSNTNKDYIPDINNPIITPKPSNPTTTDKTEVIANGTDKIVLSNVPINSTITLGTLTQTATTNTVDLIFDIPGTYLLKVELFPYLPFEATVNAT